MIKRLLGTKSEIGEGYLSGQLLIAMPNMTDERFAETVVYLCAHSKDGAMGLIVNRPAPNIQFPDLLTQLDIVSEDAAILLPEDVAELTVHVGGPVETGRGFVLHSSDYYVENSTVPVDDTISLTATLDVLRAIAQGRGPEQILMALGYAGWSAGQLETEIQANGWLHLECSEDLIFRKDASHTYADAMKRIGIDPAFLATEAGHA